MKHFHKRINLAAAGVLMLCMAAFSGCVGPQYTPEAEAGVEEAGSKKMQEWLDQKRPGAKVTKANAYIDILLGGPHVLTDYVVGSYTDGEETFRFMYNIQDDSVYTSKGIDTLQDPAWDYLLESLGLEAKDAPRRTKDEGAWVEFLAELRIPSTAEDSAVKPNHEFYQEGLLPWEIAYGEGESDDGEKNAAKRVETFLRDPDRGYQIAMSADLLLPDAMELTHYIPGELIGIMHDRGLYFDWLRIHNSREKSMFNGWFGQYSRYDWVEEGDYHLWIELDYVEDTVSAEEEKGYVRKETHVIPADFHPMIPTEKGYRIQYPEELEHKPEFQIFAEPGAEILQYEYEHTPNNGERRRDCHWALREDGSYELVNYDWGRLDFGYNTELWKRGSFEPEAAEGGPASTENEPGQAENKPEQPEGEPAGASAETG